MVGLFTIAQSLDQKKSVAIREHAGNITYCVCGAEGLLRRGSLHFV